MEKRYRYGEGGVIFDTLLGGMIPQDEGNFDYQRVLAWLNDGNTLDELNIPVIPTVRDNSLY